jgi:hypothetical protein
MDNVLFKFVTAGIRVLIITITIYVTFALRSVGLCMFLTEFLVAAKWMNYQHLPPM